MLALRIFIFLFWGGCRVVSEMGKLSVPWMEHGLQITPKRYAFSVEDEMVPKIRTETLDRMKLCFRIKVRFSDTYLVSNSTKTKNANTW